MASTEQLEILSNELVLAREQLGELQDPTGLATAHKAIMQTAVSEYPNWPVALGKIKTSKSHGKFARREMTHALFRQHCQI